MIENVQRRATKMIPGFNSLTYPERLQKLKLPTLTYRRLRGDLIEAYKILTAKYDSDVCDNFIKLRNDCVGPEAPATRGNSFKMYKQKCTLEVRKHGFPHRIFDIWNDIPNSVVSAEKLVEFEKKLDSFMEPQIMIYDYEARYVRQKVD